MMIPLRADASAVVEVRTFGHRLSAQSVGVTTAQSGGASETLALNRPVGRPLKGDASHSFQFNLTAGQFVRVVVSQRNIDLTASLYGPDGQLLREVSSLNSVEGDAVVFWVAGANGAYRLGVAPTQPDALPGAFTAHMTELRPSVARDTSLVAAELALAAGNRLLDSRMPGTLPDALKKYDEALALFRLANERTRASFALRRRATVLLEQRKPQEALQQFQEAVELVKVTHGPEHLKVAPALADLAGARARMNEIGEARRLFDQAVKIFEQSGAGGSPPAAGVLTSAVHVMLAQSDHQAALSASRRARQIYERRYGPDSYAAASATTLLAYVLHRQAQLTQAQQEYERALRIFETLYGSNSTVLINVLQALSNVLLNKGDEVGAIARRGRALDIIMREYGKETPYPAQANGDMGNFLLSMGRHAEARAAFERALKMSEPVSDSAAAALIGTAQTLVAEGDNAAARLKFDEAIAVNEKLHGPNSTAVAFGLMTKTRAYPTAADYTEGSRLFEAAIKIIERGGGSESDAMSRTLYEAAIYDEDHERYQEARVKYERAKKIHEKRGEGIEPSRVAFYLRKMGETFVFEQRAQEAIPLLLDALRRYEKISGENHPDVLQALGSLMKAHIMLNQLDETERLLRRSLSILKLNRLEEETIAVETLTIQMALLQTRGDIEAAKKVGEGALKIFEKERRPGLSAEELDLRNGLATALMTKGELVQARSVMEETIRRIEPRRARSPEFLVTLAVMANLLATQGDNHSAGQYIDRVQNASQALVDSGDPSAMRLLSLAGIVSARMGRYAVARELFNKAVVMCERFFGPSHLATAQMLALHALTMVSADDPGPVEEMCAKADKIFAAVAPDYFMRALTMAARSEILIRRGKLKEARALIGDAIGILEKFSGNAAYVSAEGYTRLGWVDHFQGDTAQAHASFIKAAGTTSRFISDILPSLSFAEQRVFLDKEMAEQVSGILTACRGAAFARAYEMMFRWKGSLIDSLRRQTVLNSKGLAGPHAMKIRRLQTVRAEIAGWYFKARVISPAEWAQKNDELTAEKERLERELGRDLKLGALEDPLPVGFKDFQSALGPDEAFIDLYFYDHRTSVKDVEERYAAALTGPQGAPVLIDLGPAARLNEAVAAWRKAALIPRDAAAEWQAVVGLLWKPLADALPQAARKVWVSPDGELARIPWQLMPEARPGGQRVLLTLTDSARELARLRQTRPAAARAGAGTLLLAGDIDFDAGLSPEARRAARKDFEALEYSKAEAEALRTLWQGFGAEVALLTGADASKGRVVSGLGRATYAHLITHGFFARESRAVTAAQGDVMRATQFEGAPPPRNVRNPMVESGIALAGANAYDLSSLENNGVLSAEEIVGLDLSRCELVTLSACETGRGEEVTGQGVMGLRASVMASGARSLLMSLWRVPDRATAIFMDSFYTNLWTKKLPKAEALLRAQEAVRDHPSGRYRTPFYWAAWTLAGEAW